MRAIARILLAMGHTVTGSDQTASSHLDELVALGATASAGHDVSHGATAEIVARSTAIPDTNPDIVGALERGTPVYSRAEILAAIVATRPAILIAGTHGKTTTSSMLSVLLDHVGLQPSFVIGSDVAHFGTGARWESSDHFVVEADESDGTFLTLAGAHAIVTSLDPDHLEFYGSAERLHAAFRGFVDAVDGAIAVCIDDADTHALLDHPRVVTYGTQPGAHIQIANVTVTANATEFDVLQGGTPQGRVSVGLPGMHNALNAAGALTIALELGVPFPAAAAGLAQFSGVARRFESRGNHLGTQFVDDYAHLPAEVEAAVATAQQGPWNRVVAAYQPHRYSRTQALGASFATSFQGVDHLVLTDIYPSGEAPRDGVTGRIVYDAVHAACPELSVSYEPSLTEVADHMAASLGPGDLCLTMGAGDLTTVPDLVLERLRSRTPSSIDWLTELTPSLTDTVVGYNEPIGALTTYRVGGAALAHAAVSTRADLQTLVAAAALHEVPILLVGKGSNMLVADRGFWGLAITLAGDFESVHVDGTTVTLGAAVSLPAAARRLVAQGLTGFEWAVGVPGTIGGAVVMNAGGHGSDMASSVVAVNVLHTHSGQVRTWSLNDLDFGYRHSAIGSDTIVLDAILTLDRGEPAIGEALLSEIVQWRRANQPGGQNAGSVFTNPPGDSAGRLIDVAGGKGLRVRSAQVSEKHANFIQADPNGSADDVYAVMHRVQALVNASAQIELRPETRLVGF
ncbi:UNVERIFIED_CONTAM: hypothetical protein GTU68_053796 [Idotea baltica]|nr:hypothetical protein [Idotea baltica]